MKILKFCQKLQFFLVTQCSITDLVQIGKMVPLVTACSNFSDWVQFGTGVWEIQQDVD